ncbi:hypothetical protein [Falsiroseomonas selenitidurans]|uniref:Uncharacterized protein n=1 Tax=Falsiroseomonas selenitidurans TaxID=2716335 RepID=A0ABX1E599_9PROT|nr:hypothetical protein [Falsiroseomonas selenitidurans]NKC32151.1 hypothetical protein [Falsiroseomonas selenitidurans]
MRDFANRRHGAAGQAEARRGATCGTERPEPPRRRAWFAVPEAAPRGGRGILLAAALSSVFWAVLGWAVL